MFQHRNFCQECFHPSHIYLQRLSINKFLFSDRQKKSTELTAMMIFRSKYYNYKRIILSHAPCLSSNLPAVEDGSANCAVDENPSFHFKLISLSKVLLLGIERHRPVTTVSNRTVISTSGHGN